MPDVTRNAFRVHADPTSGTLQISLTGGGAELGSLKIDTKDASSVAAVVLGAAKRSHEVSGRPLPDTASEDAISFATTSPSGWSVGPGRTPTSQMLLFQFGGAHLGIELANADAQLLGQRLTTTSVDDQLRPSELPQSGEPASCPEEAIVAPGPGRSLNRRDVPRPRHTAQLPRRPKRKMPRGLLFAGGGIVAAIVLGLSRIQKRGW